MSHALVQIAGEHMHLHLLDMGVLKAVHWLLITILHCFLPGVIGDLSIQTWDCWGNLLHNSTLVRTLQLSTYAFNWSHCLICLSLG
jgi:hypothetical protein